MPGIPKRDRKNQIEEKKKTTSLSDIEKKLNREPISLKEITMYLNAKNPANYVTEKTIKNHILDICNISDGLLTEDDFKNGRYFVFQPQYHGILLTLLDTSIFDDRKNDKRVRNRRLINSQITTNIDKYLNEDDKKYIKDNPMYLTAKIEAEVFNQIAKELDNLLSSAFNTDKAIRWASLMEFLDLITSMRLNIQQREGKTAANRLIYAHELDDFDDAIYQKGILGAENLEDLLISMLAYRIHCEISKEDLSLDGKFLAHYLIANCFGYDRLNHEELKELFNELDININNEKRCKVIEEKAKIILDLSNAYEKNIYTMLMFYTRMTFLGKYAHAKEYQAMQRYMDSHIQYDRYDMFNILWKKWGYSEEADRSVDGKQCEDDNQR